MIDIERTTVTPDPYLTLNLPEDADQAAIRAAYTAAIKIWPPEKDAVRFQQITQAYDLLKNEDKRTLRKVVGLVGPGTKLTDLASTHAAARNRIGIQLWMNLMMEAAHER